MNGWRAVCLAQFLLLCLMVWGWKLHPQEPEPPATYIGGFDLCYDIAKEAWEMDAVTTCRLNLQDLAVLVAYHEGFGTPGSLPSRNHNPGNLIFLEQPGATLGEGGYARWEWKLAGWYALLRDFRLKAARGMTPAAILDAHCGAPCPYKEDVFAELVEHAFAREVE